MLSDVLTEFLAMSSRSGIGRRDTYCRVLGMLVVRTVRDIDPNEPVNMSLLLALEWTQAAPQSLRVNNTAS